MPINVFQNQRQRMHDSVNQGLGFNVQNAIQNSGAQVLGDVEEARQMGRKKFASDMLSQQLAQAHGDLMNQLAGLENNEKRYHFGQEQEYYGGLHTPAGQAAYRAEAARLGLPYTGEIATPGAEQQFQHMAGNVEHQREGDLLAAERILQYATPTMPGQQERPEVTVAKQILARHLGAGGEQPTPQQPQTSPAAQPTAAPRGAFGVGARAAAPGVVGAITGLGAAGLASPSGPGALIAGGVGYLGGSAATDAVLPKLTPEELALHPTAARIGDIVGGIAPLAAGGIASLARKGTGGAVGSIVNRLRGSKTGPTTGGGPVRANAMTTRGEAGVDASRATTPTGGTRGEARVGAPGGYNVAQQEGAPGGAFGNAVQNMMEPPAMPSMGNVTPNPLMMERPSPYTSPIPGAPPSMGNVPADATRQAVAKFMFENQRMPTMEELQRLLIPMPSMGNVSPNPMTADPQILEALRQFKMQQQQMPSMGNVHVPAR